MPVKHQQPLMRLWRGPLLRRELGRVITLALPLMLGELSGMLMGVIGTMMVGHLGAATLAASGVASVVFVISMLLVWGGIRMIPTPVAEAHELRDGQKMRTLITAAMILSAFFMVVCCSLMWLGTHFFHLLGQDPEVERLALDYLNVIIIGMPMLVLMAMLFNFADAFEYVQLTMWVSIFGLALDVFLNWLFIYGHWGMPAMGIKAVAMNTGISNAAIFTLLLTLLWRKKDLQYIRQSRVIWPDVWRQTARFIRVGVPSALQVMVEFAAFGAGTIIIGQISKVEQAAHQAALNLSSVTYVTIMGISTAGMIRVGQALAYNNRAKIWLSGVASIVLATLFMITPILLFLFMPGFLIGLYSDDPEVIRLGIVLLFFAALFQLADAVQATSISLLRAINDVLKPSFLSFLAFWVVGIPLGYWLAKYQGWNAKGIWMGYLIALIIQAVLFMRRFFTLVRQGNLRGGQ